MAKSISGSVGIHGINLRNDVMTIQFLLNTVPVEDGGPDVELKVDGFLGPFTQAAINRFQQANTDGTDGRIDPERFGGRTIVELNKFDPSPNSPPVTPQFQPPGGGKRQGKGPAKGRQVPSFPPGKFPEFPSFPTPFGRKKGGPFKGGKKG